MSNSDTRTYPILFSGEMVRALLAGRKTQTRRIVKPQPEQNEAGLWVWPPKSYCNAHPKTWVGLTRGFCQSDAEGLADFLTSYPGHRLPYGPGDRIWVRESGTLLREAYNHNPATAEDIWRDAGFEHAANGAIVSARPYDTPLGAWVEDCSRVNRPSIHMPRWASRLTLIVENVRVERLQDISEEDAIAEGANPYMAGHGVAPPEEARDLRAEGFPYSEDYRTGFQVLWDGINGKRAGCSWDANPWVSATTFCVYQGNIDSVFERTPQ